MGQGSDKEQTAAANRAQANEQQISRNMQAIGRVFDSPERQAQYTQYGDALRAQYLEELDRAKGKNDLQRKFAMVRSGNSGGSLDIDSARDAGEQYQRGRVNVERQAQAGVGELRSADQASRNALMQQVMAGGDVGVASQGASSALRNNLNIQNNENTLNAFGRTFDQFGDLYERTKQQSEYRRGLSDFGNGYSPGFGFGSVGGP